MRAVVVLLVLFGAGALQAEEPAADQTGVLTVSGPQHVQDTMLLSGKYWGQWNFGKAQFLEVGVQPSTVYHIYHAVSLIRFDLSGLPYVEVKSARMRLYVPRNQTQMMPVPIYVHSISAADGGWQEGMTEAAADPQGASWNCLSPGRAWAGGPGMSMAGADYAAKPLAIRTADGLKGQWLEFELPNTLVQSWMDNPDANAGLLLRTDDNAPPGEHTDICSSQHWSGNGPQLIINGKFSGVTVAAGTRSRTDYIPRFELPPMGPVYNRWLNESADRYAVWAKDPSIGLTGDQKVFPYIWDVVVRGDIILPKAMLPVGRDIEQVPDVVARGNRARAREIMEGFMSEMMALDYARNQNWYDSGPTADVLSLLQIAKFFVKDSEDASGAHAIYEGIDTQSQEGRWDDDSPDAVNAKAAAQLEVIKERLKPTPEQYAAIEPAIRTNMFLECYHARELSKSLSRVHQLIAEKDDGEEMLKALRGMFFHHRMFLIYQSVFSMPKYSLFMENGDILGYAQWLHDVRAKQYSPGRLARQLETATRYMWKPSEYDEAEYAELKDCQWSNKKAGYSGTGYVTFDGKANSAIRWDVTVKTNGVYTLVFRYSLSGTNSEPLKLTADGLALDPTVSFSPTAPKMWATKRVEVSLFAGRLNVQVTAPDGNGPDLDYLDIEPEKFTK